MTLYGLTHYGLSGDRGYLSQAEIEEITLPADFAQVENAAARLSGLVTTGRIRRWLKDLPVPDMDRFLGEATDAQISLAMVRYAFLVQAHVWGEPTPPEMLPANLAVPFVALADRIGVPPVMNYADYILDNWCRLDRAGSIEIGNVMQVQRFAGGLDEEWFVQIHVAIEATAGRGLEVAGEPIRASDAGGAAAGRPMRTGRGGGGERSKPC